MTTIASQPQASPPRRGDTMQDRITDNIRTLRGYRGVSQATIARAIGVDPAGITARMKGETEWRTGEIEGAAVVLHVPWPWLTLPLHELMMKCTAADSNREPADSLLQLASRVSSGATPRVATSASPRPSGARVDLLRPGWGRGSSVPRARRAA